MRCHLTKTLVRAPSNTVSNTSTVNQERGDFGSEPQTHFALQVDAKRTCTLQWCCPVLILLLTFTVYGLYTAKTAILNTHYKLHPPRSRADYKWYTLQELRWIFSQLAGQSPPASSSTEGEHAATLYTQNNSHHSTACTCTINLAIYVLD